MQWIESNGGQTLTSDYPYTAVDGTCNASAVPKEVDVSQIHTVTPSSAAQLLAAIDIGPVSVTVEADTSTFQYYTSGVVNSSACGTTLDHAITAVGYGTESGQQYYLVRNSWGASWGDAGYIKIATQASGPGICGIQQTSVWPNTN